LLLSLPSIQSLWPAPGPVPATLLPSGILEVLVRGLFADFGFTISVFFAVAITAAFAILFEAPSQLVLSMLAMGVLTALVEYRMRSRQQPP